MMRKADERKREKEGRGGEGEGEGEERKEKRKMVRLELKDPIFPWRFNYIPNHPSIL